MEDMKMNFIFFTFSRTFNTFFKTEFREQNQILNQLESLNKFFETNSPRHTPSFLIKFQSEQEDPHLKFLRFYKN